MQVLALISSAVDSGDAILELRRAKFVIRFDKSLTLTRNNAIVQTPREPGSAAQNK